MNKLLESDFIFIKSAELNWESLRNKSILITGATGFIGGYLAKFLIFLNSKGFNINITCPVRSVELGRAAFKDLKNFGGIHFIESDLSKEISIAGHIDFIFHAASIATPKLFGSFPVDTLLPNILGTINLLELAKSKSVSRFIFFSTTGVNGHVPDELRPIDETIFGGLDPVNPSNVYLESKRMGESICVAYKNQFGIPINIVRPAITYGPGINLDDIRSYADFINCIVKNKNIELFSDGSAIRNYCYIADFIVGLFHVVFKGEVGEAYNLASDFEISILDLAILLTVKIFPERGLSVIFNKNKQDGYLRVEFARTTVNISKSKSLGWSLRYDIAEGFRRSVKFYDNNLLD